MLFPEWHTNALAAKDAEIERLTSECLVRRREIGEADTLRRQLTDALRKHGRHAPLCSALGGYGYCNCGFEEDLAAAETMKAEKMK